MLQGRRVLRRVKFKSGVGSSDMRAYALNGDTRVVDGDEWATAVADGARFYVLDPKTLPIAIDADYVLATGADFATFNFLMKVDSTDPVPLDDKGLRYQLKLRRGTNPSGMVLLEKEAIEDIE